MRRGEIWWAALRPPVGSESGFNRPVLIVQDDDFNAGPIRTTLVVPLTTNLRRGNAPGNVVLPKGVTGLRRASVANVSQLLNLDKTALRERVRTLAAGEMAKVDAGLKLVLSLG